VRRAAIAAIEEALPPSSAALLAGLLLGDRTDLPRDVDEAFRLAGVYHVLAVSGFNVAILAAARVGGLSFSSPSQARGRRHPAIVIVIGSRSWWARRRRCCAPSSWRCSSWPRFSWSGTPR